MQFYYYFQLFDTGIFNILSNLVHVYANAERDDRWHTSKDRSHPKNLGIDVSRGPESQLAPRLRNARPTIVSCAATFHQDSRWSYPSLRYYFPSDRRPTRPCRPDDWATSHRICIWKEADSLTFSVLFSQRRKFSSLFKKIY